MSGKPRDPSGYSLGKEQTLAVMEKVERLLKRRPAGEQTWVWLSRETGILQGHLSDYKRGVRKLQRKQVLEIAAALGATEADLAPREVLPAEPPQPQAEPEQPGARDSTPSVEQSTLPPGLAELLGEYGDKITPEERKQLIQHARFQHPPGARLDKQFWLGVWRAWRHALDPFGDDGQSAP